MFRTISKVQGFLKSCNRLSSSLPSEIVITGQVDIKRKIVYGGHVWAPTYKNSFGSLLFSRLQKLPEKEFLQVCVKTNHKLTPEDFLRKGVAVARRLQGEGVNKGDIIILMGVNSLNLNVAAAGIFFLGAVPAPISNKTKQGEIKIIFKSVRPKVLFVDSKFLLAVKGALAEESQATKLFLLDEERDEMDMDIQPFGEFVNSVEPDVASFKPAEITDPENELALVMVPLTHGPMGRLVGITHHNLNSLIARFE